MEIRSTDEGKKWARVDTGIMHTVLGPNAFGVEIQVYLWSSIMIKLVRPCVK